MKGDVNKVEDGDHAHQLPEPKDSQWQSKTITQAPTEYRLLTDDEIRTRNKELEQRFNIVTGLSMGVIILGLLAGIAAAVSAPALVTIGLFTAIGVLIP